MMSWVHDFKQHRGNTRAVRALEFCCWKGELSWVAQQQVIICNINDQQLQNKRLLAIIFGVQRVPWSIYFLLPAT